VLRHLNIYLIQFFSFFFCSISIWSYSDYTTLELQGRLIEHRGTKYQHKCHCSKINCVFPLALFCTVINKNMFFLSAWAGLFVFFMKVYLYNWIYTWILWKISMLIDAIFYFFHNLFLLYGSFACMKLHFSLFINLFFGYKLV